MQVYTPTDVFTPTAFPKHTYVSRSGIALETKLQDALSIPGMGVSISGPSKSGKTALVEKVIGEGNYHLIDGGSIYSLEVIWDSIYDALGIPNETEASTEKKTGGTFNLPQIPIEITKEKATSSASRYDPRIISGAADILKARNWPIVFDDFHYVNPDLQLKISKQFKGLMQRGLKVIFLSVPHRSEDAVRSNTDLQGRVTPIDIEYWAEDDLSQIGKIGFSLLTLTNYEAISDILAKESMGSPQIMQSLCLNICFLLKIERSLERFTALELNDSQIKNAFASTAATSGSSHLYNVLLKGPKTRGKDRNVYNFTDGSSGDVYQAIFKALALNPPFLSFDYNEMKRRISTVCIDSSPEGSAIASALEQMSEIIKERPNSDWVIDYDNSLPIPVVDFPNPYFMFYVRHGI